MTQGAVDRIVCFFESISPAAVARIDELYAPDAVLAASPRLLLHAAWLTLPHPTQTTRLTFHSPAPF